MNTEDFIVGLDIGTTKVVAVAARYNEEGTMDILGVGTAQSDGVRRAEINNIDRTVNAIRAAIEQVERHSGLDVGNVLVSVSGEQMRSLRNNGIITLNDSEAEISFADLDRLEADMYKMAVPIGMEILHVLPQEYVVDSQIDIKDPVGMSGVRLEGNFHIIMAQTNSLRNLKRCINRANLDVHAVVFQPLASSHSVLSDEEKEAGVVLVDIGGGTTDIIVYQDDLVRHTAVIPFGGNIITDDIKHGCGIMGKQAEHIKLHVGCAMASALQQEEIYTVTGLPTRPAKEIRNITLANIIQARMQEILEFVDQEIEKSGYKNKMVGGIVLTGGGAMLKNICELTEYVTGLDARIGIPDDRFAYGMGKELAKPSYAAAAGLVSYGLGRMKDKRLLAALNSGSQPRRNKPGEPERDSRTPETADPGSGLIGRMRSWFETTMTGSQNTHIE